MEISFSDTIAALASPQGNSSRGIIRVSGEDAVSVVQGMVQCAEFPETSNGRALRFSPGIHVSGVNHPVPVDVYLWPTNRSFTGQPMCEFHLIGSPPLLENILSETGKFGVRPARRGEFTLRAFLAGKLDLMQAEAVLGVIDSSDDAELMAAMKQLGGDLSTPLLRLRNRLLDDLADLEAGLDFVEEDIEFVNRGEFISRLQSGLQLVADLLAQSYRRAASNVTQKVILAGLPNAGKSSLFNRLAGESHAIVSSQAGTTRDFLKAEIESAGHTLTLIDTAGWEDTSELIMQNAQQLRSEQLANADLICWCSAADMNPDEVRTDEALFHGCNHNHASVIRIWTKSDVNNKFEIQPNKQECRISVVEDMGIETLQHLIAATLQEQSEEKAGLLATTFARCQVSLEKTQDSLHLCLQLAENGDGDELIALELRQALGHLGEITGEVYTDDILDRIFSKFCIGK